MSVGSKKTTAVEERYYNLGINYILKEMDDLFPLIDSLALAKTHAYADLNTQRGTTRSMHHIPTNGGILPTTSLIHGISGKFFLEYPVQR